MYKRRVAALERARASETRRIRTLSGHRGSHHSGDADVCVLESLPGCLGLGHQSNEGRFSCSIPCEASGGSSSIHWGVQ